MLFALSLGILMSVFERAPESVTGGTVRKTMSWIGGKGFVDPVPEADEMRNVSSRTAPAPTTTTMSDDLSEENDSLEQGSVVLESMGSSGVDIGEE